jgi:hypothetical protein
MSVQKGLVYDKLDDQKPRDSYETDETMRPYSLTFLNDYTVNLQAK